MSPQVDTGQLIEVRRFTVFDSDSVESLLERTYDHLLVLCYDMLALIASGRPLPRSSERWTREPFKRGELNDLCRLRPDMPLEELRRRIRATTFGNWAPTVEIGGYVFRLDGRSLEAAQIASPGQKQHEAPSPRRKFNILLSAAGRRVALLRLFRHELDQNGFDGGIVVTDVSALNPTFTEADRRELVYPYSDRMCLEHLLKVCQDDSISLIIPTIDPDLPFYAEHRTAFETIGTQIMISSAETVRICNDKQLTHDWLLENKFPTVRQIDAAALVEGRDDWPFPVFIKPRGGSSSLGAQVVHDRAELERVVRDGDYIAQDIAPGREYTVDVYVDRQGRCRCTVPRLRIETRGGEVVKGMTVRNRAIEDLCCQVAEALPGAWGVMNIQVFYDDTSGALNVSEINPRFGGGYPLTHQAGAPMTRWIIEEVTGQPLTANNDKWIDRLVMLRYDEAVFVNSVEAGLDAALPVAKARAHAAAPG